MIFDTTGSPIASISTSQATTPSLDVVIPDAVGGAVGGAVGSLVVITVTVLVVFICVSLLLAKRSQQKSQHKVDSNRNTTLLSPKNAEYNFGKRKQAQ